jgi:hypothetical protein
MTPDIERPGRHTDALSWVSSSRRRPTPEGIPAGAIACRATQNKIGVGAEVLPQLDILYRPNAETGKVPPRVDRCIRMTSVNPKPIYLIPLIRRIPEQEQKNLLQIIKTYHIGQALIRHEIQLTVLDSSTKQKSQLWSKQY